MYKNLTRLSRLSLPVLLMGMSASDALCDASYTAACNKMRFFIEYDAISNPPGVTIEAFKGLADPRGGEIPKGKSTRHTAKSDNSSKEVYLSTVVEGKSSPYGGVWYGAYAAGRIVVTNPPSSRKPFTFKWKLDGLPIQLRSSAERTDGNKDEARVGFHISLFREDGNTLTSIFSTNKELIGNYPTQNYTIVGLLPGDRSITVQPGERYSMRVSVYVHGLAWSQNL
jgi:hypothetical protein